MAITTGGADVKVRDFCSPHVVTIELQASLREAALLMRNRHVGALVVVEASGGAQRPVGMLTDRDIVVAVIAVPGARPEGIRAGDAMSQPLIAAREDDGIFEAVETMQQKAVRRLPVLGAGGALRGIVTADDVLRVLSAELGNLAEALRWGRKREFEQREPI
jgi:CBS domain-containing protein